MIVRISLKVKKRYDRHSFSLKFSFVNFWCTWPINMKSKIWGSKMKIENNANLCWGFELPKPLLDTIVFFREMKSSIYFFAMVHSAQKTAIKCNLRNYAVWFKCKKEYPPSVGSNLVQFEVQFGFWRFGRFKVQFLGKN